jgi:hypothetical protein
MAERQQQPDHLTKIEPTAKLLGLAYSWPASISSKGTKRAALQKKAQAAEEMWIGRYFPKAPPY